METRRANVDDIPQLVKFWDTQKAPSKELEKRLTDFQIVHDDKGAVLATLGMRVVEKQGKLYGEYYSSPDQAGVLRKMLWERIERVCKNTGLIRIWCLEPIGPWSGFGFKPIEKPGSPRLPELLGSASDPWAALTLIHDTDEKIILEKEFEMFIQSEKNSSEQMMKQAKALRLFAFFLLFAFVGSVIYFLTYVFKSKAVINGQKR